MDRESKRERNRERESESKRDRQLHAIREILATKKRSVQNTIIKEYSIPLTSIPRKVLEASIFYGIFFKFSRRRSRVPRIFRPNFEFCI